MKLSRRSVLSGLGLLAASTLPVVAAVKPSQIRSLQGLVEDSIQAGNVLELPPGTFKVPNIRIDGAIRIAGVPGRTHLVAAEGGAVFTIADAAHVTISGVTFDSGDRQTTDDHALVTVANTSGLTVEGCHFANSRGSGLRLENCSGRITGNHFSKIAKSALFARNSKGLDISGNTLLDIGNNGIQVWTSEPSEDGTIISANRIARVASEDGGTGQNGNGINIYKAGNVIVSGNRISDCAFSAIRNNAGSNCQISGNSISRTGEVAIYCEFGFQGAVVSGNLIEDVALGISITNFNEGGRLATVANNVIRIVKGGGTLPYTTGVGIGAEADTAITGNVIEDCRDIGIAMGWGAYGRNLSATGNVLRNCATGISFSVAEGADAVLIANNRISGSTAASIIGTDHREPRTPDLGLPGAEIPRGVITGNLVF